MGSEAAEIREAIEHTRAELGETVQALAYKTDVKARAHDKVDEVKQKGQGSAERVMQKVAEAGRSASRGVPDRRRSLPVAAVIAAATGLFLIFRLKNRSAHADAR